MSTESPYPYIYKPDGETACLRRHPRVRVAQIVMDYFAHGWSADEMCRHHPHLKRAEAHAAMLYYWDHQDEIDAEISKEWQLAETEAAAATIPPVIQRLMTSKTRVA